MSNRYVRFKSLKELVRSKMVKIVHVSDDGEFMRLKILPNGPEVGRWNTGDDVILVVNCPTEHENFVNTFPQLFDEVTPEPTTNSERGE